MKVEQVVVRAINAQKNQFDASERVELECEVIQQGNGRTRVRILEAGAGLKVGDEIGAPPGKVRALAQRPPRGRPNK